MDLRILIRVNMLVKTIVRFILFFKHIFCVDMMKAHTAA